MRSLLDMTTSTAVYELLDKLKSSSNSSVSAWARHKANTWVISGYCQACSGIPTSIWESVKRHTNSAESLNFATNTTGKQLSLLDAWKQ